MPRLLTRSALVITNTYITDRKNLVLPVWGNADVEVFAGVEDGRINTRRIVNFVERVGGVGEDSTKEDLLVAVPLPPAI